MVSNKNVHTVCKTLCIQRHCMEIQQDLFTGIHFIISLLQGGKKVLANHSPDVEQNKGAKKVYAIDNGVYSVHNNKHFRIVCQIGAGSWSIDLCFILKRIADNASCTFPSCKSGKELSDKANRIFSCRHLDFFRERPPLQPEMPILCETIRYATLLLPIMMILFQCFFSERDLPRR